MDLFIVAYLGYAVYIHICSCTVEMCSCVICQLCDMSVSNPLLPNHNGTNSVNMVNFLQNECMCVLKNIVDVKQLFG